MPTTLPTIATPPVSPQRNDPLTFSPRSDNWLNWTELDFVPGLQAFAVAANALAAEIAVIGAACAENQTASAAAAVTATAAAGVATTQAGLASDAANATSLDRSSTELAAAAATTAAAAAAASAASIAGGPVLSVNGRHGAVLLGKADVGLSVVDNTPDAGKPISTAMAAALAEKQDQLISGVSVKTINGQSVLGSGNLTVGGGDIVHESRSANTALGVDDKNKLIDCTSTFTQTFAPAATLTAGWSVSLRNVGTGNVTLDPNGSETIDGLTSGLLYPGMTLLVVCTGVAFQCVRVGPTTVLEVKTSGTSWVCPLGVRRGRVIGTGGGGSGCKSSSSANIHMSGASGATFIADVHLIPGTTYTYAIGAGGSGVYSVAAGNAGGDTTFTANGVTYTAQGGVGGRDSSTSTPPIATATNGTINLRGGGCGAVEGAASYWGGGGPASGSAGAAAAPTAYGAGSGRATSDSPNSAAAAAGVLVLEY